MIAFFSVYGTPIFVQGIFKLFVSVSISVIPAFKNTCSSTLVKYLTMEYDLFSEPNKEFPEVNPFMYAPMIIINTTKKNQSGILYFKNFFKKINAFVLNYFFSL